MQGQMAASSAPALSPARPAPHTHCPRPGRARGPPPAPPGGRAGRRGRGRWRAALTHLQQVIAVIAALTAKDGGGEARAESGFPGAGWSGPRSHCPGGGSPKTPKTPGALCCWPLPMWPAHPANMWGGGCFLSHGLRLGDRSQSPRVTLDNTGMDTPEGLPTRGPRTPSLPSP